MLKKTAALETEQTDHAADCAAICFGHIDRAAVFELYQHTTGID